MGGCEPTGVAAHLAGRWCRCWRSLATGYRVSCLRHEEGGGGAGLFEGDLNVAVRVAEHSL